MSPAARLALYSVIFVLALGAGTCALLTDTARDEGCDDYCRDHGAPYGEWGVGACRCAGVQLQEGE